MSYSDKYRAIIKPVPAIIDGKISWGWEVSLTDKSDDKTYSYASVEPFATAEDAMKDGGTTMVLWMKALDKVLEVNVQEINLDADLPEPEPVVEEKPADEETKTEEESKEEKPDAEEKTEVKE